MVTTPQDEFTSILADIRTELAKDEPKILLFVGSGVSIGATGAPQTSWHGLLQHGIEYLINRNYITATKGSEIQESLRQAFAARPFDIENVLQHAQYVKTNLITGQSSEYADWLALAFSNLTIAATRSQLMESIKRLVQAGTLVITTNYDSLLSEATDLPPVTWENEQEFNRVALRRSDGILHLHGHWKEPSSVILSRDSYEGITQRIQGGQPGYQAPAVARSSFQELLRYLWLHYSWLYVGCGDGLDDPNLGPLLAWSRHWESSARPDYFFAQHPQARVLNARQDKPGNLQGIGYASHDELPKLLDSLIPSLNCAPFMPVDEELALFRPATSTLPVPSLQEYRNGEVPQLAAETEVLKRLSAYGWAFILSYPSVGKTTLALRIATMQEQHEHLVFYLDLGWPDVETDHGRVTRSFERLVKSRRLFILDNANRQPELARRLWELWRDNPRGSRLLLIGTRVAGQVMVSPNQELAFFETHPENPSIDLRPEPEDLAHILACIAKRNAKKGSPFPQPTPEVLCRWHKDFGRAIAAFCFAAQGALGRFRQGQWALPHSAAADWVRQKWTSKLDAENAANLRCLAVFGAQEFEMMVDAAALPYPGHIGQLTELVAQYNRGQHGQWKKYSLREPGWGELILASQTDEAEKNATLLQTVLQSPVMTLTLVSRTWKLELTELSQALWNYIEDNLSSFMAQLVTLPLGYVYLFLYYANVSEHVVVEEKSWNLLWGNLASLVEQVWQTPLSFLTPFLEMAKRNRQDIGPLWKAIEDNPQALAKRAWETPLGDLASFFETAQAHKRDMTPLWLAIEGDPQTLVKRAWETPLHFLASFFETARRQGRETAPLWKAIEDDPKALAKRAWETPLGDLASFLETARRHGRETAPLWKAIEDNPQALAKRAWETPFGDLASFFETAQDHKRDTTPLWLAIEGDPQALVKRAWESPLHSLASFLETARRQGRETAPLWKAIEDDPKALAKRAWETPLSDWTPFLETARRHRKDTTAFWVEIQREPIRIQRQVAQASFSCLAGFMRTVPQGLTKRLLDGYEPAQWTASERGNTWNGATTVARHLIQAGLPDHGTAIVEAVLKRANPKDFGPRAGGFHGLIGLLSITPDSLRQELEQLMDRVCTPWWLSGQFKWSTCGSLATGLRLLAFNGTEALLRRLVMPDLCQRLEHEQRGFLNIDAEAQSEIVQLVGSAALCGVLPERALVNRIPEAAFQRLPEETLPHAPEAVVVDEWQYQLWLGLRVITAARRAELRLSPESVTTTLELWRASLATTATEHESPKHLIDTAMVDWLEQSAELGLGIIFPEPLPVLFPWR